LVLPIENVGAGPAINIRGGAEAIGSGIITGSGRTLHPVEGLSPGQSNAVLFESQTGNLEPRIQIAMRLLYEDIAGITHATDLRYSENAKAFQCTIVEPPVDLAQTPPKRRRQTLHSPLASVIAAGGENRWPLVGRADGRGAGAHRRSPLLLTMAGGPTKKRTNELRVRPAGEAVGRVGPGRSGVDGTRRSGAIM